VIARIAAIGSLDVVVVDRGGEGVGPHAERIVDRDFDHVLAADAERDRAFLDVRMRVLGDVHAQRRQIGAAAHAALADIEVERLARRG
jgi:5-carboxymethyl-2-hydroxymuconate isomerase